jgi:predicted RNase H-like HicB family nuclease
MKDIRDIGHGLISLSRAPSELFHLRESSMEFNLECEREEDGRWLAEVALLPGVLAYGASANEAMAKAEVLALRVLAEQLEHGETLPVDISICIPVAA